MTSDNPDKALVNFIFEAGQLKRVARSGWWIAHINDPETVAEHTFRSALIGFLLASEEGANPDRTASICVFHDLHETRLNDLHKIGHKYLDFRDAENKAFSDQINPLPRKLPQTLLSLMKEYGTDGSKEGILAKDAELLECAFQAKEYLEHGYPECQGWIDNVRGILKSKIAKRLLLEMEKTSSSAWWIGLKKIER
jgi:putative hydrolases of HD superfamily